jgi:SSS family solute:Na+ symporter
MADYIVAGRSLNSFISVATMLGSEIGLVTVMYTAQKGFTGGFAALHIGLAAGLMCLFVGLTGFIVVPLRRTGVMTIPEYYGQRFGKGVRVFGGVLLAVAGILNMGVFLKAGAIFVTTLTGMESTWAVNAVMTSLIALVLAYTILGGMVSVVITDYIQFVVLSFGLLLACGIALTKVGWGDIVLAVETVQGSAGFNPLTVDEAGNTNFGPAYIVWMFFSFGLVSCAVWPTAVMRACAARDEQVVKRLYVWSSIGFMTRFFLPQFLGICALAYLWKQGPSDFFPNPNELTDDVSVTLKAMPTLLSQILPVGVIGLIGAAMLAAFMSTHDSYLLCWAAVIVEDVIQPLCKDGLSVRRRLLLARIFIFLIGVFLLAWSLFYPMKSDMLDYLAVSGAIYFTGAFAVLVLGLYWRRASRVGAYLAMFSGSLSLLGLGPVKEQLGHSFSEAEVGLLTTSSALILMVVGSLAFPQRPDVSTAKEKP